MNITQRFTLLVKGKLTNLIDTVEDPEASLDRLIMEMASQLERALRATSQAIANERRLRVQVDRQRSAHERWSESAQRALDRGDEVAAREALRRSETALRQAEELDRQLMDQEHDTAQIRSQVQRLQDRLRHATTRLHLLRARLRQTQARRAMGQVLRGVEHTDAYGEFQRLGERVELMAAEESVYLELRDDLSGAEAEHRFAAAEIDDAVEERFEQLLLAQSSSQA